MTSEQHDTLRELTILDNKEKRRDDLMFAKRWVKNQSLFLDWVSYREDAVKDGLNISEWFPKFGFKPVDETCMKWTGAWMGCEFDIGEVVEAIEDWAERMEYALLEDPQARHNRPNLVPLRFEREREARKREECHCHESR